MKHCPICNRSSDEARFFGEFCEFCAGKKLRERLSSNAEISLCRDCGRIKVAGVFVPNTEANVQRQLSILFKPYLIRLVHHSNGIARVQVTDEKREGMTIEHNVHVKMLKLLCDDDAKKRAGYYEAVVQLRGEEGKVSRMAAALERYLEKNDAFITKSEVKEHGVDLYASNKKTAFAFISSRHLKFKGSYELHGEKRGKRLYRNTYFITL
ncbi:MAG: 60S ribosomal export protein NMD3 [Candidatus Marsarchaeota archaeon]|nr:60S ribosomal export protein NMD3 [Candidatus Marsarchaeota archaeon]